MELKPGLDEILAVPDGTPAAVWAELPADTETPVTVFLKLRRGGTGFLLESAEQDGSLGRYSFIGVAPEAVLRSGHGRGSVTTERGVEAYDGPPMEALGRFVGDAPVATGAGSVPVLAGGAVGYLGYDLAHTLEKLPHRLSREGTPPVALFARYPVVVVYDHLGQRLLVTAAVSGAGDREEAYRRAGARIRQTVFNLRRAAAPPFLEQGGDPAGWRDLLDAAETVPSDADFQESVEQAREYIHAGEVIQVVLSRRMSLDHAGDPFRVYRTLRRLNPSPYMFFLEFPEVTLVGASPEMLVRAADGAVQLSPIAGTRPRGGDPDADAAAERELTTDEKERAEHLMLVDLSRNDLGRVCRPGSVHVPRFMDVERYSHVMHLVSTVTGRLRDGTTALDALAASFPAGTVSGAPKVRAMEIIEEMETVARGVYAGAAGYVGAGGQSLDTCIAIRTLVFQDGRAHLSAGAGIVADSEPARELEESRVKAAALLAALAAARTSRPEAGDLDRGLVPDETDRQEQEEVPA
ncbi:MAG TPA: anthranilate synthase component I family protein [Longimicrobiales bacterium]|nr:anthranilate synthase component I family protein [Longimicrobiales bacterium]